MLIMGGWEWVILAIAPLFLFGGSRLARFGDPDSSTQERAVGHHESPDIPSAGQDKDHVGASGGTDTQVAQQLKKVASWLLGTTTGAAANAVLTQVLWDVAPWIVLGLGLTLVWVILITLPGRFFARSDRGPALLQRLLAVGGLVGYICLTVAAAHAWTVSYALLATLLATTSVTLILWPTLRATVSRRDTLSGIASILAGSHLLIVSGAAFLDVVPLGGLAFFLGAGAASLLGISILTADRARAGAACMLGGCGIVLGGLELLSRHGMGLVGGAFVVLGAGTALLGSAALLPRSCRGPIATSSLALASGGTGMLSLAALLAGRGMFGAAFLIVCVGLVLLAAGLSVSGTALGVRLGEISFLLASLGLGVAGLAALADKWVMFAIACLVVAVAVGMDNVNIQRVRTWAVRLRERLTERTPTQ